MSDASGIAGKRSALTRTLARVKADGKFLILRVYRFVTQKPCEGEVCFGQVRFLARTPGVDLGLEESRGWPGVTVVPFGLAQASEGWGSKSQGPNIFRVAVISICEFPILLGRSEPWWSWEAAGKPGSLGLGSELPQPISRQLVGWAVQPNGTPWTFLGFVLEFHVSSTGVVWHGMFFALTSPCNQGLQLDP